MSFFSQGAVALIRDESYEPILTENAEVLSRLVTLSWVV